MKFLKVQNTTERISAGKAILHYLNNKNHLVIVSTHDIELTELLENNGYSLYHFCEEIVDGNLLFNYHLKESRLKTRNAIKILELYNYPNEIINDAKNTENLLDLRFLLPS
jgi:DNA mismatch repair ATPase MutS